MSVPGDDHTLQRSVFSKQISICTLGIGLIKGVGQGRNKHTTSPAEGITTRTEDKDARKGLGLETGQRNDGGGKETQHDTGTCCSEETVVIAGIVAKQR